MSGLSDSNQKELSTSRNRTVQVQEVPPYQYACVDFETASKMALSLSPQKRLMLLETVYSSIEESFLKEPHISPYQKMRVQHANISFCLVFASLAVSLTTSMVCTALWITGTLPAAFTVASGVVTSTSSAICLYCFKLYKDTNNRLDHSQMLYRIGEKPLYKVSKAKPTGQRHRESSRPSER